MNSSSSTVTFDLSDRNPDQAIEKEPIESSIETQSREPRCTTTKMNNDSFQPHGPARAGSGFEPIVLPRTSSIPIASRLWRRPLRRSRAHPVDDSIRGLEPWPRWESTPRSASICCTKDDLLESTIPSSKGSIKFPEFDALGAYVHSEAEAARVLAEETDRIMDVVQDLTKPLSYSSEKYFESDNEAAYRNMSRMCQKVTAAINICLLDNETISAEHCSHMAKRTDFENLINQVRYSQRASKGFSQGHGESVSAEFLQATFNMLDYISAVLARLIVQMSSGHYWQTNILGALIKRITKLKLLLIDLPASAAVAMRAGEAALVNLPENDSKGRDRRNLSDEEECEEYLRMLEEEEKNGTTSWEERQIASHCVDENRFRGGIDTALKYILMSMRFINRSGMSPTAYEICSVAYETGFEGFKALLFQDRDLEYSATSDADNLNTAHTAFSNLHQTALSLKKQNHQSRCTQDRGAQLEWAYSGSENTKNGTVAVDLATRKLSVCLTTMDQVITMMVSLATVSPIFLSKFTAFRHSIALSSSIRSDVRPQEEGHFNAFARMYTPQFMATKDADDILRLSEALDDNFFSRSVLVQSADARSKSCQNAVAELDDLTKRMEDWVLDETCVTVFYPRYVWSMMAVAALCAAGGLAIGFSVGDRIHGVDPSNLATYLWVVAAFMILVFKSIHVRTWTWNDFLRGRVRCGSVSELQSVTGIDSQLIIAKLLHDERKGTVLNIRGPYNSVFLERSSEGFSIDMPISPTTLLLSGLLMLKVVTAKGHALVCLDSRRDTDLRVIGHTPDEKKDYLFCDSIDRAVSGRSTDLSSKGKTVKRHAFSRMKGMRWKRVQGIYKSTDSQFV